MKTLPLLLVLMLSIILINCSSDDENLQPVVIENPNPQDNTLIDYDIPMESLTDIGAIAITGYPKILKRFENGILNYWAHYYFRPDGNMLKVNFGFSNSISEISDYIYQYDDEGKMVKFIGDGSLNQYWDNGRIIKAEYYNHWYGSFDIIYDYNDKEQLTQKSVKYTSYNPIYVEKSNYSYYDDGNLESIVYEEGYDGSGIIDYSYKFNFVNYIESRNLFLDLQIIPGQRELQQFPSSKGFRDTTYPNYNYITYNYKYDGNGRVIERTYGDTKIVYEYY
ncbi:hypothetical protein OE09_1550 [Flavobacteriaceae bacterium MAR_2010_72]|nr:hypothetical protein OE09_1550 [Flavobacteriaceae bacterium MAR_2010_72]TVZ59727.1 hypothetical protein NA63_2263 [Flavobacteriaceae bacterium MAR_2010_105]